LVNLIARADHLATRKRRFTRSVSRRLSRITVGVVDALVSMKA
jgi:hypothetical protein